MQSHRRRNLAYQAINWIVHSHRPLSPTELQHGLAVKPGRFKSPKGNLTNVQTIISVCAGLLTVDEETDVIRFVHYTTQEYLDSGKVEEWIPSAEAELARACITYLLIPDLTLSAARSIRHHVGAKCDGEKDSSPEMIWYRWPIGTVRMHIWDDWLLLRYATTYWGAHCQYYQPQLQEMAMSLLFNHSMCWYAFQARDETMFDVRIGIRAISICCYWGLNEFVKALLEKARMHKTNFAEALTVAVRRGFGETVKVLFECGRVEQADIDHTTRNMCRVDAETLINYCPNTTTIRLCSTQPRIAEIEDIMQLLITREHFDTSCGDDCRDPMVSFARRENGISWIGFLLQEGRDVNAGLQCGRSGSPILAYRTLTALQLATKAGLVENVRCLLNHAELDVFGCPSLEETIPLEIAAFSGYEEILTLLLRRADPKSHGNFFTRL